MCSIRYRILLADTLMLLLGLSVVLFFTWIMIDGGWKDFRQGPIWPFIMPLLLFVAGALALVLGVIRLAIPGKNPALRALDRAGPRGPVIAALNAELAGAPTICAKFKLTPNWFVFLGKLSVKIVRLDDVVLILTREWRPEHRELVLCDAMGTETCFHLDGFEINRLLTELRNARPSILVDDAQETWDKWRRNPRNVMIGNKG